MSVYVGIDIEASTVKVAAIRASYRKTTNDGGITLAAPANPPTTYGMLESRLHNVSVSLDGPPVIEASFTFQFPNEAPTLSISGRRVVVFGLKPNWAEGLLERLMWATDVLAARDGTEQRVSLRAKPRRSLEFSILVGRDDAALLDVLLRPGSRASMPCPSGPTRRSSRRRSLRAAR